MSQPDRKAYVLSRFEKEIAQHTVTIMMDNGVYRHLRCKRPGSWNCGFDIITTPGVLLYRGDMGCFVFERLEDMFEFFRVDIKHGNRINEPYWSEKLVAADRHGGYQEHTSAPMIAYAQETFEEWANEQADPERVADLRAELDALLNQKTVNGNEVEVHLAVKSIGEWLEQELDTHVEWFDLPDFWEFSFHFTWCCYAILWAIAQYDAQKAAAAAPQAAEVAP